MIWNYDTLEAVNEYLKKEGKEKEIDFTIMVTDEETTFAEKLFMLCEKK